MADLIDRQAVINAVKLSQWVQYPIKELPATEAEVARVVQDVLAQSQKIILAIIDAEPTSRFGHLYFPSEEAATAAIEAVGEDRIKKYYLGVKE